MGRKKKEKKKKKDEDRIRIKDLLRKINTRDSGKKRKRKHSHRDLSSSPSSSDSESEYVSKPKAIKKIKKSRKINHGHPAQVLLILQVLLVPARVQVLPLAVVIQRQDVIGLMLYQKQSHKIICHLFQFLIDILLSKVNQNLLKKKKNQFHDKIKGVTGNQSSSSLKEIWSTKNSVSVSNRSDKPTSEGVLPRNIPVNFRSETYPFILSTEQFLDFIIDLESTVGEKLNTKNFIFSYAIDIMGKSHQIKLNSQVTFMAFINYLSFNKTSQVNINDDNRH